MWSIFSWIIDKRDKAADLEKQNFYKNHYDFETRIEGQLKEQRESFEKLRDELTAIRLEYTASRGKMEVVYNSFHEYVERVNKVIETHADNFGKLGKVIDLEKI